MTCCCCCFSISPPSPAPSSSSRTRSPRRRNSLLLLLMLAQQRRWQGGYRTRGRRCWPSSMASPTTLPTASPHGGHDCCRWAGVTCSNQTGHVTELHLGSSWSNPPAVFYLGQISPSLLSLEYLEYLDLNGNLLDGPNQTVPEFLGSMKNLRHLDLSDIPFSGRFPSFLTNLSQLEYLYLQGTTFSGILPSQLGNLSNLQHLFLGSRQNYLYSPDISWLPQLQLLEDIQMYGINLSKIVDLPLVLNMVPTLKTIMLMDCSLPSANHTLTHLNLTKLEVLNLSRNYFDHPLSLCWFWNLTSIEYLNLDETYLYGPFPNALGSMISLKYLSFHDNGNAATIHVDLKDLCALESLGLGGSLSSRNITELLEKLPQCPSNKLKILDLSDNNFNGPLPTTLRHLSSLSSFDLSSNSITGAIPPQIGNISSLYFLDLSYNSFTGAIPQEIVSCTSLTELDLSNSHLTGTISLGTRNYTSLFYLDLSNNNLTGSIGPMTVKNFPSLSYLDLSNNHITELVIGNYTSLSYLYLSNNNLTGSTGPMTVKNFPSLSYIDLSNNNLTGSIGPMTVKNFPSLSYIDLSTNHLNGVIPQGIANFTSLNTLILHSNQLTGQVPTLPRSLIMLDISMNLLSGALPLDFGATNIKAVSLFSNNLSGHIPRSICELQNMFALDLSNNSLEGELPKCFQMTNMVFLLLSSNKLSGKFPPPFKSCSSLAFIDLAWNNFKGTLPSWIGDMVNLQFLQLSHNMFDGDIPVNITNLRRLQHFNLAGNHLSGTIPWSISNLTAMTKKHPKKRGVNMVRLYTKRLGKFEDVIHVVIKQQELKYGSGIFELVGIDLSLNHLTGEIPSEITSLNKLMNLNLSWNQLSGNLEAFLFFYL